MPPYDKTRYFDILERYDMAILSFARQITTDLPDGIPAAQVLYGSPGLRYADAISGTIVEGEMLRLPRIAVTRVGEEYDPKRENSALQRNMQFVATQHTELPKETYTAWFPYPVRLRYQFSIWVNPYQMSLLNILKATVHMEFKLGYKYFQIDAGNIYSLQTFAVHLEGSRDASDLEPGGASDRVLRTDYDLNAECWFFYNAQTRKVVHTFAIEYRDYDTEELIETQIYPKEAK